MSDTAYSSRFSRAIDMKAEVGNEIGLSHWVKIDQQRIDTFAEATGDFQWIHTDPSVAEEKSPYGTTIAHGFHILSLAPKLIYESYHIDDAVMGVNYGMDRVRFPHEVPVDSEVRVRVKLEEVEDIAEGVKLTMDLTFEIRDLEEPACVAKFIALVITEETENI